MNKLPPRVQQLAKLDRHGCDLFMSAESAIIL
jgi:hypothetical protein